MVAEALAGLSAFKTMFDLAKGLKDANDTATRNAVAIELQEKILAAQAQQMALVERVHKLEEKIVQFENWDAEKQCYELKTVDTGAFAYAPKPSMKRAEPPHWLCTNCFEKRHKSILQFKDRVNVRSGGRLEHARWVCGVCQSVVVVGYNAKP